MVCLLYYQDTHCCLLTSLIPRACESRDTPLLFVHQTDFKLMFGIILSQLQAAIFILVEFR